MSIIEMHATYLIDQNKGNDFKQRPYLPQRTWDFEI